MSLEYLQQFLIAALVFVPLERFLALNEDQRLLRRRLPLDFAHILTNGVLVQYGLALVIVVALGQSEVLLPHGMTVAVASQPFVLQFLEVLLIADFGFYLAHRAFHHVPFLWRFHAVHHSIEEMDWIAAHRVHPVDQILTKSASLVPVFILGFDVTAIVAFSVMYQWQGLLIHSNLRIRVGPLRWLLASPQFHHWHHANHSDAIDKNFAGQLPLWDVLFGTVFMPEKEMPEAYGTDYPVPMTYVGQLAHPFVWSSKADAAIELNDTNSANQF